MMKTAVIVLTFCISVLWGLPGFSQSIGVTEKEIRWGQSAAFKGTSAALGSELWRGAQAYFEHINSQGGINGRQIRIVSLDDGYEGDVTIVNTIKLIKKEKVFALFGYVGTPTIVKALPVIQKFSSQGVFLFSNFTGAQPQRELPHSKYVFNIRTSYRQETEGLVDNLVKIGYQRIGVFIQNDAYGRSGADGVQRALRKRGLTIFGEATYERGTSFSKSMSPQVDVLQKMEVDAVISIGSYAACAAFIRDARFSGFKGPIANVSFVGADQLLTLLLQEEKRSHKKLTKNLINSQVVPPWNNTSVPLVKKYQKLMAKYQPKVPENLKDPQYVSPKFSFVSLEGFLNAVVLVEVLKRAPKNLTRKNFVETLEGLKDLDVGLGQNISFSESRHDALTKVFFTTIVDDHYTMINDWKKLK